MPRTRKLSKQIVMLLTPEWLTAIRELAWESRMTMVGLLRLAVAELATSRGRAMPAL